MRQCLCILIVALPACVSWLPEVTAAEASRPVDVDGVPISAWHWPADRERVSIPFGLMSRVPAIVGVEVNGTRLGRFLIDTGSEITIIDTRAAKGLGLRLLSRTNITGHGGRQGVGVFICDELKIDAMRVTNTPVVVADISGSLSFSGERAIDGLIGADVLARVPFTVDYRAGVLTFHDREAFAPPAGANEHALGVRLRPGTGRYSRALPPQAHPSVAGTLNGTIATRFVLDTGQSSELVVGGSLIERHKSLSDRTEESTITGLSVIGSGRMMVSVGVADVRCLGASFTPTPGHTRSWLADEQNPANTGEAFDQCVIGYPWMHRFALTFDFAGERLWTRANPRMTAKQRIASGVGANDRDAGGSMPIDHTIMFGTPDDVRAWVETGAKLDAESLGHTGPLSLAATYGRSDMIALLLDAVGPGGAEAKDLRAALATAAMHGHADIVGRLLDTGIDARSEPVAIALQAAARYGRGEIVERFVDHGCDVNATSEFESVRPLAQAALGGHGAIYRRLLEAGATVDDEAPGGMNLLLGACEGGDVSIVRHVLDHLPEGVGLKSTDREGRSPLHVAVWAGHLDVVALLIERGADVNARDKSGFTPLLFAIATTDVDHLRALLDAGAETELTLTERRLGIEHSLAQHGRVDMWKHLTKRGIKLDVNRKTTQGVTPIFLAATFGRTDMVDMLREQGADTDAPDHLGRPPPVRRRY